MYDGSVDRRSGMVVINLPGISDDQPVAPHGDEEKRLLYPDITSWTHIDERSEYERRYPYMPDRIIDNLVKPDVRISVAPWGRINGTTLEFLIDAAFRYRKDCPYDLSRPMRRANSCLLIRHGRNAKWPRTGNRPRPLGAGQVTSTAASSGEDPGFITGARFMTARASTTWTPAPVRRAAPAGTNRTWHTSRCVQARHGIG